MKTRLISAISLVALLSVPALAQDAPSGQGSPEPPAAAAVATEPAPVAAAPAPAVVAPAPQAAPAPRQASVAPKPAEPTPQEMLMGLYFVAITIELCEMKIEDAQDEQIHSAIEQVEKVSGMKRNEREEIWLAMVIGAKKDKEKTCSEGVIDVRKMLKSL